LKAKEKNEKKKRIRSVWNSRSRWWVPIAQGGVGWQLATSPIGHTCTLMAAQVGRPQVPVPTPPGFSAMLASHHDCYHDCHLHHHRKSDSKASFSHFAAKFHGETVLRLIA